LLCSSAGQKRHEMDIHEERQYAKVKAQFTDERRDPTQNFGSTYRLVQQGNQKDMKKEKHERPMKGRQDRLDKERK